MKLPIPMIEKYISELLLVQDSVVVPNLGVFTSTFATSSLSADGGTIVPPRKAVSFSIYIKEEDKNDALMKSVMRGENMSYYDFNEQLLAFVQQVQESIVATNSYLINGLGTLIKDGNNKIVLLQANDVAFLGDSFGLPPIDTTIAFDAITKDRKDEPSVIVSEGDKPAASKTTEETSETYQNVGTEVAKEAAPKDTEEPTKEGKKSEFAWWAAVVPLVLLLACIAYLFVFPDAMQGFKAFFGSEQVVSADLNANQVEETEESNPIDNVVTDDTARFSNDETENQPIVENTISTPKEETIPSKDISAGDNELNAGRFYLVYGSFGSKAIAEKVSKPLAEQGLSIKIVPLPSKSLFRIVIGDFASHADATSKKTELGSEFSQTWVLQAQ